MKVLGLFSGIGGFELGFQRAGFDIGAMCEIEPYCRKVLAKRFPGVPVHEDVRSFRGRPGNFDIVTGGFPCQDISLAGKGAGLDGERSGLWSEYRRIIEEIQPAWVVIENVSALRSRGLDQVLREIAALGYDAEWHCIPACAVGALHRRDRVWIVAYPFGFRQLQPEGTQPDERRRLGNDGQPQLGCDPDEPRLAFGQSFGSDHDAEQQTLVRADWWPAEPDVGRVAHGVPARVDRLKALGNAVVPQIPELIARAIRRWEFLHGA